MNFCRFGLLSLLITVMLLVSGSGYSQTRKIDSLSRIATKGPNGKARVKAMNAMVLELIPLDINRATELAAEAVKLAENAGSDELLAWALIGQATCLQTEGLIIRSEKILRRVSEINLNLKNPIVEGYATNLLGNGYRDKGRFDSAYFHYRMALRRMQGTGDSVFPIVYNLEISRFFNILDKGDSVISHVDQALEFIPKTGAENVLREAYILKASGLTLNFRYAEAEDYLKKAIALSDSNSTSYLRAAIVRGKIRFSQGDYAGALTHWRTILETGKSIGYRFDMGQLLLNVGEAYEEQGFWKIASEFLSRALEIAESASFHYLKGEVLFENAWIAYRSGSTPEALAIIGQAENEFRDCGQKIKLAGCNNLKGLIWMARGNYDSSLHYHNQALLVRETTGNLVAISSSLFNLGELFNNRKEYRQALKVLQRGLKIDQRIGDQNGLSMYYYQIARASNALGRTDSVAYLLKQAIRYANPNTSYDILLKSYLEMAGYLKNAGRSAEAVGYLEKYIVLSDSVHSKQSAESVAAYEALFEVEAKEKEIRLLNKDRELALADARTRVYLLYGLGLGTLVLVVLLLVYSRIGNRLKRLNEANEEKAKNLNLQAIELGKANNALKDLYIDLQGKHRELQLALENLQKAQDQLIKSEKMASLGVMAAGIAHELNNPLNFIKGGVSTMELQLAKEGRQNDATLKPYLDIIQEGVNRASSILRGLGQYSRQTDVRTESCDVHKIIENCLVILTNSLKYHVKVVREFSAEPFILTGNEGKLHQVFINLLTNAEQAIKGEGTITISSRVDQVTGKGSVAITDTGSGIAPDDLKRLGDLFFTTKEPGKGTGLGLSIAYKIIEEHRGKVFVTSEVGKGTTFLVTFKLVG